MSGLKLFFVGMHHCESLDEGFRLTLNQNLVIDWLAFVVQFAGDVAESSRLTMMKESLVVLMPRRLIEMIVE